MPSSFEQPTASSQRQRMRLVRPRHLRRGFRALSIRNYRLFWLGQLVSLSGNWMQTTAQAWLVLQLSDSPFSLGLVTTLQFLPVTLLALYGGVLADRLRKRESLVLTQFVAMILALIFGLLVATDVIQLWHVYILAIAQGIFKAIDTPIRQAFVIELVGRDDLSNAVALNSMGVNGARIFGPALAGFMIDQIGIAPTLIANGISFIPVLLALLWMDAAALHIAAPARQGSVMQRLREGLSYTWHTPAVLAILMVVAAIGTFGYNFSIVLPLLARYVLGTSATGFGSLTSFLGFGSLIAAISTAYAGQVSMRRLFLGAGMFGGVFTLLALSENFALSGGLLFLLGIAGITFATASNTLLQLKTPDDLRGRIMSVYVLLFMGSTPIGGFLIGVLSDLFGVQAALFAFGLLASAGVLGAYVYYVRAHVAQAEG